MVPRSAWLAVLLALSLPALSRADNLVLDPSFEAPKERDRWGHVFTHWGGWIYEGECSFRVSSLARTGKHSLLIVGGNNPKIRAWPAKLSLAPGRYRVTAYLRGLDIATGPYGQSTEFMFAGNYLPLNKAGTFGWSKLTYVGEVKQRSEVPHPGFGLMAPGLLWVDDVSVEKVDDDTALTPRPRLDAEEQAIEPPGRLPAEAVRCPECGYRNALSWGHCYACGGSLTAKPAAAGPAVRTIATFETRNPFSGGTVVREHAREGSRALRLDRGYVGMDAAQDWTGYDYLEADVHTEAREPLQLNVEIRDRQTRDYWTRVNYTTVVPPGSSTVVVPTALYVGEKSRPGRPLQTNAITRLVFALGDKPAAPLYLDNIRLRRDTETARVVFPGLHAFDLGPAGAPVMEGFTPLDVSKRYTSGRGYGWKNARIWRAFDALQPDPLYRDFICVEGGGLALDVPNGRYHVFVNMDSPSGFWGEVQRYRRRALILEGQRHEDRMDLASFRQRYYRHWQADDLPDENTFDKYQIPYFREKFRTVEVRDGQLNIDFEGENWACAVSAIIVFPEAKAAEGKRFLDFVRDRRRFHFDTAFKRVLHPAGGEPVTADAAERQRGFVAFSRDPMTDVYHNDRPAAGERATTLTGSAFAGEYEPITVSVLPLGDPGTITLTASALRGPADAVLPASAVTVGYVQHRVTRVTAEGSVYTIQPRLIVPRSSAPVSAGVTRTFWLTVRLPEAAVAGLYTGTVELTAERGGKLTLPLRFRVLQGRLDAVDMPVGPWGHTINLPWYDEEVAAWNRAMANKSLRKLREYGFTTATGLPVVRYLGFRDGKPRFDFTQADEQMRRFQANGFRLAVVSYCPFPGLDTYYRDEAAMKAAGFSDYPSFVRAVFSAVQEHARAADWLPVYWNLADEPLGDDLARSAANAEAYRQAFPAGPPWFTGASSFTGGNPNDPHFRLSKALHVANWNLHDEAGVQMLHKAGGRWGFYNGGNRWTYGVYLYKAATQFNLQYRIAWHWNVVAGDPYYALDCREDDYAWCNSSPEGELLPSVEFERLREGLDDYRRLRTLARLVRERGGSAAAQHGETVLEEILGAFRLGDRELKGAASFAALRERLDAAIERLR